MNHLSNLAVCELNSRIESIYINERYLIQQVIKGFRLPQQVAEDILQETFLIATDKAASLLKPESMLPWMKSIARNLCMNQMRSNKLHSDIIDDHGKRYSLLNSLMPELDGHRELQEMLEISSQQLEIVIDSLKNKIQGSIARQFYIEEKSIKEICLKENLKQNTVCSHLRRFRLIFSKAMLKYLDEEDCLTIH